MRRRLLTSLGTDYLCAVLVATALGSIVQTQFNVAALTALGVPIPLDVRFSMTARDLVGFTPIYGAMVAITMLLALPAAALIARVCRRARLVLFLAAGACGILGAFLVADTLLPMPTFVAATRGPGGLAAMAATAALGSTVFALLRGRPRDAA